MSLMDTIKGARQEAEESGIPFEKPTFRKKDDGNEAAGVSEGSSSQGFTRRSAAKAKPSRQAAAGVQVVRTSGGSKTSKPKGEQTKEERKAERKHDREIGDLRYNVTQQILEEREDYQRAHKMWWKFLIGGVILMVAAIGLYMAVSNMKSSAPEWMGVLGIVTMVAAYGVVIAGLVYDWVKVRPIRREVDAYVQSMSEKRLINMVTKKAKEDQKNQKPEKSEKKGFPWSRKK